MGGAGGDPTVETITVNTTPESTQDARVALLAAGELRMCFGLEEHISYRGGAEGLTAHWS